MSTHGGLAYPLCSQSLLARDGALLATTEANHNAWALREARRDGRRVSSQKASSGVVPERRDGRRCRRPSKAEFGRPCTSTYENCSESSAACSVGDL